ncbi:nitroreductase family protein [Streptomyces sp. KR80]|uniref:nitroreductase family protein n=1 Tax=Streptomyces sp. KR80 TaxID=3457426 RepID=UPI003FD010CC
MISDNRVPPPPTPPHELVPSLLAELSAYPSAAVGDEDVLPHSGEENPAALAAALERRHSAHTFATAPLPGDALERLLAEAGRAAHSGWPDAARFPVGVVVLALRVTGVARGFHRYDTATDTLRHVSDADFDPADAVLQREFAHAAAVLVTHGPVPAAVRHDGAHGYRRLLLRGAAAVSAAWLGAARESLAACGFAGLLPDVLRTHGVVDVDEDIPLLALAVGLPEPPGGDAGDRSNGGQGGRATRDQGAAACTT